MKVTNEGYEAFARSAVVNMDTRIAEYVQYRTKRITAGVATRYGARVCTCASWRQRVSISALLRAPSYALQRGLTRCHALWHVLTMRV